ncbi:MAG: prolyl oligopeptidase family serine peptidase, partial [Steroidobacteraceae bacterium]|nr:prolyl oligopeptidase family serine peptidase [Steroidobacteraceae bacterium]MDW8259377.1 prolyl oligopeptidase family serine peptidase [Gammaproteobacteria bacterium]
EAIDERIRAVVSGDAGSIASALITGKRDALSAPVFEAMFAAPYRPTDWQPLAFVAPGAPPALLVHGARDRVVAVEHSTALEAALRAAGATVRLLLLPALGHADTVAAFSPLARRRGPVFEAVGDFVRQCAAKRAVASTSSRTIPGSKAE